MALVPVDRQTGRKRQTSEQERGRLKRESDKADFNTRNRRSRRKR